MCNNTAIEGKNVAIGYRDKTPSPLYCNMNFTLKRGELTALLGINGAGKSTLLRTMSGTQPTLAGEIILSGKNINNYHKQELARHISLVLTERNSAGGLRVHELVALGRFPYTGFFGKLNNNDRNVIDTAMHQAGIGHKRNYYVSQLSDGERQKAYIAKALSQECDIILLDEPTAFLDLPSRIEMFMILQRIAQNENKAILITTHDLEQALSFCTRLWLLSPANGLQCGSANELISNGAVETLFCNEHISFDPGTIRFIPRKKI